MAGLSTVVIDWYLYGWSDRRRKRKALDRVRRRVGFNVEIKERVGEGVECAYDFVGGKITNDVELMA